MSSAPASAGVTLGRRIRSCARGRGSASMASSSFFIDECRNRLEEEMPRIDPEKVAVRKGSGYPEPFRNKSLRRMKRALGDAAGLTQFGVNLVRLPPGEWSSQRHWHSHEDEFIYMLEGEVTLITDDGEE